MPAPLPPASRPPLHPTPDSAGSGLAWREELCCGSEVARREEYFPLWLEFGGPHRRRCCGPKADGGSCQEVKLGRELEADGDDDEPASGAAVG